MANPLLDMQYGMYYSVIGNCISHSFIVDEMNDLVGPNRVIVPFIACGDLK